MILLNFETRHGCATGLRIKDKIDKGQVLFVLFLIFIVLNTGTILYLLSYTLINIEDVNSIKITLVLLMASLVFLGLTLLVSLYYFITDYFIDKTWTLKSFEMRQVQKMKPKPSSRYQVAPVSVEELAE